MRVKMNYSTYLNQKLVKGKEYTVDEKTGKRWVAGGLADEVADNANDNTLVLPHKNSNTETLVAFAAEHGVDLSGANTNAERYTMIEAWAEAQAETEEGNGEGE